MNGMKKLIVVILFLVLGTNSASAQRFQDFEKGLKVYQAGVLKSTNPVKYFGE